MAERKRPRVSSSTQTAEEGLTEVVFSRQEVDDLVSAALKTFGVSMEKLYNDKLEALSERQRNVEDRCEGLEHEIALVRTTRAQDLDGVEARAQLLRSETERLTKKVEECERWVNSVEQHSRRSSLRIRGLQPEQGEDPKLTVLKFVNNVLGLRDAGGQRVQLGRNELDAAHPLPVRQPPPSASQGASAVPRAPGPAPFIVAFHDRATRDLVISARRQLKGKRFSIAEDLTAANQRLLLRVRDCPAVESAWSWQGKVTAVLRGEKRPRRFDLHDRLPSLT